MKKLLDPKKVDKFFDILDRLDRTAQDHYLGIDKLNPDSKPCQQDIFVKRTVAKWFKNKKYKWLRSVGSGWYKNVGGMRGGDEYKVKQYNYVSTATPTFDYGRRNTVSVNFSRASGIKNENVELDAYDAKKIIAEPISQEKYDSVKDLFKFDVEGYVETEKVENLLREALIKGVTMDIKEYSNEDVEKWIKDSLIKLY